MPDFFKGYPQGIHGLAQWCQHHEGWFKGLVVCANYREFSLVQG